MKRRSFGTSYMPPADEWLYPATVEEMVEAGREHDRRGEKVAVVPEVALLRDIAQRLIALEARA